MIVTIYLDWGDNYMPELAAAFASPATPVLEGSRRWRIDLNVETGEVKARLASTEEQAAMPFKGTT